MILWWGRFKRQGGLKVRCMMWVHDSVVLAAGRSTPVQGETVQRGEGVALVLRGLGLTAWR